MSGMLGALAGPWGLAAGIGANIFGSLFGNRQQNVPPPKALYPGAQNAYMTALLGNPSNGMPGLGPTAMQGLTGMIQQGGMAPNYMPNVEAITAAMGRSQKQAGANLLEQFGKQGLRFSSPAITGAQDLQSQIATQYGSLLSQFAYQSQNDAASRLMQAIGYGTNMFQQPAMATYASKTMPGVGPISGIATGVGDVLQTISLMQMMGLMPSSGGGGTMNTNPYSMQGHP